MNIFFLYTFTCIDEDVEITYSYWDGSGHRRHITVSETVILSKKSDFYNHGLVMPLLDEEGSHYSSVSAQVSGKLTKGLLRA